MREALAKGDVQRASSLLADLKVLFYCTRINISDIKIISTTLLQDLIINFDSLPPLGVDGPTALQERVLARAVYECAVQVAVQEGDTDSFQRYVSSLRPFYAGYG